jgi:hypothetical protein
VKAKGIVGKTFSFYNELILSLYSLSWITIKKQNDFLVFTAKNSHTYSKHKNFSASRSILPPPNQFSQKPKQSR